MRAIANSVIFAWINLACARELLLHAQPPLRTAYRLTGGSFALFALFFLVRAVYVGAISADGYGLYAQLSINPLSFFIGSVIQLTLVFGFVLMINYQIAGDLQKLAAHDSLTGALNRRSLEEVFSRLCALYARSGGVLSVMMLDVDYFKRVNDQYGHLLGDEVLRQLAILVRQNIRQQDYFARYGGEEFCILLPGTSAPEAVLLAERLRQACGAAPVRAGTVDVDSTISIGVADSAQAGLDCARLIAAADHALYQAKQAGRNQVQCAPRAA